MYSRCSWRLDFRIVAPRARTFISTPIEQGAHHSADPIASVPFRVAPDLGGSAPNPSHSAPLVVPGLEFVAIGVHPSFQKSMSQVLPTTLVIVVSFLLFVIVGLRGHRSRVQGWLLSAFFAHVACAFGQVWVARVVYGGGDMFAYLSSGNDIARLLDRDFWYYLPGSVSLVFHLQPDFPIEVFGAGTSTGAMVGWTGLATYCTGSSLYATAVLFASVTFFGKLALYRAVEHELPADPRLSVLAVFFVPTVLFWSSGILKEALAMAGVGLLTAGVSAVLRRRRAFAAPLLLSGALLAGSVKPYLLFPFAVSAGAWVYWSAMQRRDLAPATRPILVVFAALIAIGGMLILGEIFPRYGFSNLGAEIARSQAAYTQVAAGSTLSDRGAGPSSLMGQLAFVPLGILSALLRPFLLEVRNAPMLVNALETTTILLLIAYVAFRGGVRKQIRFVADSPFLVFCVAFTLLLAAGVGVSTLNLGSLSRYRIPMMPFYVGLLLTLAAQQRHARNPRPSVAAVPDLNA